MTTTTTAHVNCCLNCCSRNEWAVAGKEKGEEEDCGKSFGGIWREPCERAFYPPSWRLMHKSPIPSGRVFFSLGTQIHFSVSRKGILTLYSRFISLSTHFDKNANEHFLTEVVRGRRYEKSNNLERLSRHHRTATESARAKNHWGFLRGCRVSWGSIAVGRDYSNGGWETHDGTHLVRVFWPEEVSKDWEKPWHKSHSWLILIPQRARRLRVDRGYWGTILQQWEHHEGVNFLFWNAGRKWHVLTL